MVVGGSDKERLSSLVVGIVGEDETRVGESEDGYSIKWGEIVKVI